MQKGDKLKVVEKVVHSKRIKKRITIGVIEQITKRLITIKRIHDGKLRNNISFNIADFRDITKEFYIEKNSLWVPIKIKVTEHSDGQIRHGCKYD
ncbi:hypothetical protein CLSAB_18890 [Clostridium saccharobutylicum]|uniref:hypothetical protein n=1 Tax=Clostridium saccharobutylicum TaxID=169679 RepID=UPI00098BF54A|nr:hypothetical protein [Clostridium saccharobutylicum]OOM17169.1 hypothetical protein CLSAB_18890 [Clostridium saccharobutylicum]